MAPNEAPECLADGRKKKNRGGTTSRNTKISAAASKARADTLVAQAKEAKAAAAQAKASGLAPPPPPSEDDDKATNKDNGETSKSDPARKRRRTSTQDIDTDKDKAQEKDGKGGDGEKGAKDDADAEDGPVGKDGKKPGGGLQSICDAIALIDGPEDEGKGGKAAGKDGVNKPGLSYGQLIALALFNLEGKKGRLCDIYEWLEKKYPFFAHKDGPKWWKVSTVALVASLVCAQGPCGRVSGIFMRRD